MDEPRVRTHLIIARVLIIDLAATAVAALGLGVLLSVAPSPGVVSGGPGTTGIALLSAAWLLIIGRIAFAVRAADRQDSGIRQAVGPRALVAAGAGLAVAHSGSGSDALAAALGLAVLIGGLTTESMLNRVEAFRVPVVAHLPGVEPAPVLPQVGRLVVGASLSCTLFGLVVAGLGISAWLWLVVCLAAVSANLLGLWFGRLRVTQARRLRREIPGAVAAYAPAFAVYTSRPDDASYQVTMWLPYLQRTGMRFIVVTRDGVPAAALAGLTDVPVIEARRISDLDGLIVPSLRAAFYVNASSGNGAFVRYPQLTHVYLGHGDSDKPPSYNPTHAMYDQIFAAGEAATRRYGAHGVRIPMEKFTVVGRPQVEDVHPVERPISAVTAPVVLYAPTWRGHVEETLLYSLPDGERIVESLLARGCTVIFRAHPFSYGHPPDAATIERIQHRLADHRRETGREHLWGEVAETSMSILDCINASDAMVSDVSSVVSDYLFSRKPFAMIAVPSEPGQFVADYPVARAAYVVRGDLSDLEPALDRMLGDDPLAGQRAVVRIENLGDFPAQTYASAFVETVRDVASHESGHDFGSDDEPGPDRSADPQQGGQDGVQEGAPEGEDPLDNETGPGSRRSSALGGSLGGWVSVLGRYRQALEQAALDLGSALVAVVGLSLALLGLPAWLSMLLAVAALTISLLGARDRLRDRRRWSTMLGRSDVARTVVAASIAVAGVYGGASPGVLVTAAALLAAGVVAESHMISAWGRLGLQVHDFPAARADVTEVVPRGLVSLAGFAGLALGCVVVALGAPDLIVLITSSIVFVLVVDATARAMLRATRVVKAENGFVAALTAYRPEFAVYFASTVGADYQIGMWLPYFVRIGRPFVIITRSVPMLHAVAELTAEQGVRVPIIYRPTLRSVEDVIVGSLTTAFYVNNAARNTHFVERRELTHVWLNHGDSEKPACYNPVHAIYDLLFSAGEAGIDRYARHHVLIPLEKFRIVGRPQVELIRPARGPVGDLSDQTVLYAPTWQGPFVDSRVFSLPIGRQIVAALLERGARVVFRAHPFNYRYPECRAMINDIGRLLQSDRASTGREHVWGDAAEHAMTVEDCFNASDAMISDVSAVVSDYLKSEKPFAMVAVGRTPEELVEMAPAARAAYVLKEDLSNLTETLDDLLDHDSLAQARAQTRVYYLGDFDDATYADGFLDAARSVIDRERALAWKP